MTNTRDQLEATSDTDLLRIGELSRRSGVSADLLRAWERRYGLLRPARSAGGLRLYSSDDLDRVREMRRHLSRGIAAAEAAALVHSGTERRPAAEFDPTAIRDELGAALESFDEPRAQAILDSLLAGATLDTALSAVVVPYLHELGERWERGEATVAQEHFATAVLRGRLLALTRGWGRALGPHVLLACAPGEQHDLGLLAFGLALKARGWRIFFLGPDTPIESIAAAADAVRPAFVVLSAVDSKRFSSIARQLSALAKRHRLCLAGEGARRGGTNVIRLTEDPVDEAERLTALVSS